MFLDVYVHKRVFYVLAYKCLLCGNKMTAIIRASMEVCPHVRDNVRVKQACAAVVVHQPRGITCCGIFAPAPAALLAVFSPAPDADVSVYAFAAAVAAVASDAVMAKEHRSAQSFPKKKKQLCC